MSDSYPTIQDSLSDVQKEFLGCVEMHLDPPEDDSRTYDVESLFSWEHASADDLPGTTMRFTLSVADGNDADLGSRRHTIEFVDVDSEGPKAWVRHSMRRREAMDGRFFWTESQFEVSGPGIPDGKLRQAEVEREVMEFVDKIRVLDRARALREIQAA